MWCVTLNLWRVMLRCVICGIRFLICNSHFLCFKKCCKWGFLRKRRAQMDAGHFLQKGATWSFCKCAFSVAIVCRSGIVFLLLCSAVCYFFGLTSFFQVENKFNEIEKQRAPKTIARTVQSMHIYDVYSGIAGSSSITLWPMICLQQNCVVMC